MAVVHIDNLAAGMVLKQDVRDRSGRLLLPEGAELTGKHLVIFRSWGVLEADIVGGSENDTGEEGNGPDPALVAAAEELVRPLFAHNDLEHPAMRELFRICVSRKVPHDD